MSDVMIGRALDALRPKAKWALTSDGLDWQDETQTEPTQEEIDAKVAELETNEPLKKLRGQRDRMLQACDWTQGADVPDYIKLPYQTYRQALRDITDTYSSLDDVVWPDKPA